MISGFRDAQLNRGWVFSRNMRGEKRKNIYVCVWNFMDREVRFMLCNPEVCFWLPDY